MTFASFQGLDVPTAAARQVGNVQDTLSAFISFLRASVWIKSCVRCILFLFVVVVSLGLSVVIVSSQFYHTNILYFGEYGLARHLDGTVYRPFAYRVFTDWLARGVLALHLPSYSIAYLDDVVTTTCPTQHAAPLATCDQVKAYVMVATVFAWGFLVSTYILALRVAGGRLWALATMALAALIVNSLLLQGRGQPYDCSTLFFATTLFLLAAQQRDIPFALLLIVACLTKESLVLFVPVFALIAHGQRPTRQILRNLFFQSVIFVVVYEGERTAFSHNLGASMYHNFAAHLQYIVDNTTINEVVCILISVIILLYRLPQKPAILRRSMLVLPVMLVLYFVGGQPGEFRIAVDVFPIMLLPVMDTVRRMITGID